MRDEEVEKSSEGENTSRIREEIMRDREEGMSKGGRDVEGSKARKKHNNGDEKKILENVIHS